MLLIDADDKLPHDITFKTVAILMTCVVKDSNKFYSQLFLDQALYDEETHCKAFKKRY